MKKVMLVFGTRPEAIKMCPLVAELRRREGLSVTVCVTGQHRQMLDGVLDTFSVVPDFDLSIMREGQSLFDVTRAVLGGMERVLSAARPDVVLVHGDTATAFATALACFYLRIPVGHVEAGLRTYDLAAPFPEEFDRRAVSIIAAYHFAPTAWARDNLLREGVPAASVFVTGNTGIDALAFTVREGYSHPLLSWSGGRRLILLTAHRRENLGEPMAGMFRAVRRVVEACSDIAVVCPVHRNPAVRRVTEAVLGGCPQIRLTEPQDVSDFHNLLARCYLVITDSGGIQEEAAALRKPVLVMRETTERPEGLHAGVLRLVGREEGHIAAEFRRLLDDPTTYRAMANAPNPYGDGTASRRIADILEQKADLS